MDSLGLMANDVGWVRVPHGPKKVSTRRSGWDRDQMLKSLHKRKKGEEEEEINQKRWHATWENENEVKERKIGLPQGSWWKSPADRPSS